MSTRPPSASVYSVVNGKLITEFAAGVLLVIVVLTVQTLATLPSR
jgi:hypothetical protein